jgi:hypothetical protein
VIYEFSKDAAYYVRYMVLGHSTRTMGHNIKNVRYSETTVKSPQLPTGPDWGYVAMADLIAKLLELGGIGRIAI